MVDTQNAGPLGDQTTSPTLRADTAVESSRRILIAETPQEKSLVNLDHDKFCPPAGEEDANVPRDDNASVYEPTPTPDFSPTEMSSRSSKRLHKERHQTPPPPARQFRDQTSHLRNRPTTRSGSATIVNNGATHQRTAHSQRPGREKCRAIRRHVGLGLQWLLYERWKTSLSPAAPGPSQALPFHPTRQRSRDRQNDEALGLRRHQRLRLDRYSDWTLRSSVKVAERVGMEEANRLLGRVSLRRLRSNKRGDSRSHRR